MRLGDGTHQEPLRETGPLWPRKVNQMTGNRNSTRKPGNRFARRPPVRKKYDIIKRYKVHKSRIQRWRPTQRIRTDDPMRFPSLKRQQACEINRRYRWNCLLKTTNNSNNGDRKMWSNLWSRNIQQTHTHIYIQVTQKKGTFEKPNKNWRNPRKKKLLKEIEPLQLAF